MFVLNRQAKLDRHAFLVRSISALKEVVNNANDYNACERQLAKSDLRKKEKEQRQLEAVLMIGEFSVGSQLKPLWDMTLVVTFATAVIGVPFLMNFKSPDRDVPSGSNKEIVERMADCFETEMKQGKFANYERCQ